MVTYLLPLALQPMQLIRETLITSCPILPDSLIPVPLLESPWGDRNRSQRAPRDALMISIYS